MNLSHCYSRPGYLLDIPSFQSAHQNSRYLPLEPSVDLPDIMYSNRSGVPIHLFGVDFSKVQEYPVRHITKKRFIWVVKSGGIAYLK